MSNPNQLQTVDALLVSLDKNVQSHLDRLTKEDTSRNWKSIFDTAQQQTDKSVKKASEAVAGTEQVVVYRRVEMGMRLVKNSIIGMMIMMMGVFIQFIVTGLISGATVDSASTASAQTAENLTAFITSIAQFMIGLGAATSLMTMAVGGMLVMFGGTASTTKTVENASKGKKKAVSLVIPEPVTYHAEAEVDKGTGALYAKVSRRAPSTKGEQLVVAENEVARIEMARDETAVEAVARFEALLAQLDVIEEKANVAYNQLLTANGLDERQRMDTLAKLRAQAETTRDRFVLNNGLVGTLNAHAKSREELTSTATA